jgi:segregation and condensation protein A
MDFSASTLEIQMECYEGPLAVLIGLIKKNKISIWDIPISFITEKFLQYVEVVKELQLKVAEDFIELASLLIYIKSRMLLPSNGTDEDEIDPREELVERILEYERLKTMVHSLDRLPFLDRDVFCGGTKPIDGEEDFSLIALCDIFLELMRNQDHSYIVVKELRPTLEERLNSLRGILEGSGIFVWDLMNEEGRQSEKVATILAMLELTKRRIATIMQRRAFGTITLKKRALNGPAVIHEE